MTHDITNDISRLTDCTATGPVSGLDDGSGVWEDVLPELVQALYGQGKSARDLSELMELSVDKVNAIVRAAGVIRSSKHATTIAKQRRVARTRVFRLDLAGMADRWVTGCEVEQLAAEEDVPPDLLWDALALQLSIQLSATGSDTGSGTETATDSARGSGSRGEALECAGVCTFECIQRCALTTGNSSVRLPGDPDTRSGTRRREGIRSVRTGLDLPPPGPCSQWRL
jgi:hypothetical protein